MPITQLLLDYVRRNSNFPAMYSINQRPKRMIVLVFTYVGVRTDERLGSLPEVMTSELTITPTLTVEMVWDWIQENDYAEERRRRGAGRKPENMKTIDLPELTMGESA